MIGYTCHCAHSPRAHALLCACVCVCVCVNSPWLQPDHPDPKGYCLDQVVRVLNVYTRSAIWGVFWDYMSLYQHPSPKHRRLRTDEQERLFNRAVEGMSLLYAHPHTTVFKLTKLPAGYPEGYHLPLLSEATGGEAEAEAKAAEYDQRGWTTTESNWAALTKRADLTLDICEWSGRFDYLAGTVVECSQRTRKPPLLPDAFAEMVVYRRFTNGKVEAPLMGRLYARAFEHAFVNVTSLSYECRGSHRAHTTHLPLRWAHTVPTPLAIVRLSALLTVASRTGWLRYEGLGWGDYEALQLVSILRHKGGLKHLTHLSLSGNLIGDYGASPLASACLQLPCIRTVDLSKNRIDSKGMVAIRAAYIAMADRGQKVRFDTRLNVAKPFDPSTGMIDPKEAARQRKARIMEVREERKQHESALKAKQDKYDARRRQGDGATPRRAQAPSPSPPPSPRPPQSPRPPPSPPSSRSVRNSSYLDHWRSKKEECE